MLRSRTQRLVAAALVLVIVLGVAGWWFFIRDDAPEEVNADQVRETLDEEESGDDTAGDDAVDGTWVVDPSIGSFDDFSGTFAGYRIEEELASIGTNEAVGRTPGVTGTMTINENQVTEAAFDVDMTSLVSDDSRRDNQLRGRGLETDAFPTGTFRLTEPLELPENATSGTELTFAATGELTLHGVTNPVTIDLTAQFDNGRIGINGSAPVVLADYDIEPPEGFSVLSVSDSGTFEFQIFLTRQ